MASVIETAKTSTLIEGIVRATRDPGISRAIVFRGRKGTHVYAYSVFPADPTKIVREDAEGHKAIGHLVRDKFKALRSKAAHA